MLWRFESRRFADHDFAESHFADRRFTDCKIIDSLLKYQNISFIISKCFPLKVESYFSAFSIRRL